MRLVLRVGLVILAGLQFVLGVWGQFFPESFYRNFPTVSLTPPYSEHFLRDFGGATLALGLVIAAAAVWLDKRLVMVALLAYLVFAIPHLCFHLAHLRDASQTQVTFLLLSLGNSVLLPVALLVLAPRALRVAPTAE